MSRLSIKPLDRITEAYNGDMGEEFRNKTRNRINWIVNHVQGNKVLDIGCSQGIVPIILGREGKQVLGIDIATESINYALNNLEKEHVSVRENIDFKVSNFMTDNDINDQYDTVLLTEVLEHISDPNSFLKKIKKSLNDCGILIVTVPFGINDYFDHKRTYYYLDLYEHLSPYFEVTKVEFLGKWTGVVCSKKLEHSDQGPLEKDNFNRQTIQTLEKAFYDVERDFINRIEISQKTLSEKNNQIKNLQSHHKVLTENYKETLQMKDANIQELQNNLNQEKSNNRQLLNNIFEENIKSSTQVESIINQQKILFDNFEGSLENKNMAFEGLRNEIFSYLLKENNTIKLLFEKREADSKQTSIILDRLQKLTYQVDLYSKDRIKETNLTHKELKEILDLLNKLNSDDQDLLSMVEELKNIVDDLKQNESNFLNQIQNQNNILVEEKSNYQNASRQIQEQSKKLVELSEQQDFLQASNKALSEEKKKLEIENHAQKLEINNLVRSNEMMNEQIDKLKKDFNNSLLSEEKALNSCLKQNEQIDRNLTIITNQEKKIFMLERKYAALKSSKLGKVTLKYWKLRKNYKFKSATKE